MFFKASRIELVRNLRSASLSICQGLFRNTYLFENIECEIRICKFSHLTITEIALAFHDTI